MSEKIIYIIYMIRINFIYLILLSMALSDTYKEPQYNLIRKDGKIETREYSEYVIAKTSIEKANIEQNSNMFRVLAGYIFGGNADNQSIAMTAPVITQNDNSSYDMIFFMLNVNDPEDLPIPNNQNIVLEKMQLGKTVTISFGMWATEKRIAYYKNKLDAYIRKNDIQVISPIMVAQYNSPWTIPPFRKNELIYSIK